MNRVGRLYKLKNGYGVSKCECYDGYNMQYFWAIFTPSGEHYKNCKSYEEAYLLASKL